MTIYGIKCVVCVCVWGGAQPGPVLGGLVASVVIHNSSLISDFHYGNSRRGARFYQGGDGGERPP